MAFFLRDCTIGIAHIDDDVIIAGRGIQEWLQPPSLVGFDLTVSTTYSMAES